MRGALKTTITHAGQKYVDEEVRLLPSLLPVMELSVALAFGRDPRRRPLLVGYNRVPLNWKKKASG